MAVDAVSTGSNKDDAVDATSDAEKTSLNEDALDQPQTGLDHPAGTSPFKSQHCASSVDTDVVNEDQWVLLDCHFGVPLFDADVNRSVCRRIATRGLCHQDRYCIAEFFYRRA